MISRQVIVPKAPSWPGGFISIIEANPGYAGMPRNSFLWTQIAWVSKFLNVISKELRHDISQPIGCFLRVDFAQDWSKNHPWTKDSLSDPTTIYKDWVTYIPKVVTQGVWTNSKKTGQKHFEKSSILTPFPEWCEISSVRLAKFLIIFQQTWKFGTACFGRLNLSRFPGEAWWQRKSKNVSPMLKASVTPSFCSVRACHNLYQFVGLRKAWLV